MVWASKETSLPRTMKIIQSLLRHLVTGLAGLGTYLGTLGLVDAGSVDAANSLASQIAEPLAGLLGLVVIVIFRLAMTWLGKRFPSLAGLGNGVSGMSPLLAIACMTAGLTGFCLPSCSPAQVATFRAFPVRLGITGPNGDVGYSSKAGLSVDLHATK